MTRVAQAAYSPYDRQNPVGQARRDTPDGTLMNARPSKPSAPDHTGVDDEALVRALQSGDERVFSDLVDRWSRLMLRLALAHVGNRAVAEEVVQEA